MRKSILSLSIMLLIGFAMQVNAQSCYKITMDQSKFLQPSCNLQGAGKVYMHSGACSANSGDCAVNDSIWKHIVGNWGMDDGLGLMTALGNGIYEISLDPQSYYGTAANINTAAGGTVMPSGATVYSIGLVFRNDDGMLKGADNTVDCGDLFIKSIDGGSPFVVDHFGDPFNGVTFTFCTSREDALPAVLAPAIYPNPSQGNTRIDLMVRENIERLQVRVVNTLGQEVARLHDGFATAGAKTFNWADESLGNGIYFLQVDADGKVQSERIALLK